MVRRLSYFKNLGRSCHATTRARSRRRNRPTSGPEDGTQTGKSRHGARPLHESQRQHGSCCAGLFNQNQVSNVSARQTHLEIAPVVGHRVHDGNHAHHGERGDRQLSARSRIWRLSNARSFGSSKPNRCSMPCTSGCCCSARRCPVAQRRPKHWITACGAGWR